MAETFHSGVSSERLQVLKPAWQLPWDELARHSRVGITPQRGKGSVGPLWTEHRDKEAALRFLKKAIRRHGVPEQITIDGSDANEAAIKSYNEAHGTSILIRQVKYLNNMVEQDHRGVKRVTRPMLGFKSFKAAQDTLVGIELMHMIKKRQLVVEEGDEGLTAADLFYSLAA
jgi:putative transposase